MRSITVKQRHPFSMSVLSSEDAVQWAVTKMVDMGFDVTIGYAETSALSYVSMSKIAIKHLPQAKALADSLIGWYNRK